VKLDQLSSGGPVTGSVASPSGTPAANPSGQVAVYPQDGTYVTVAYQRPDVRWAGDGAPYEAPAPPSRHGRTVAAGRP
jgi:hypothetical protein